MSFSLRSMFSKNSPPASAGTPFPPSAPPSPDMSVPPTPQPAPSAAPAANRPAPFGGPLFRTLGNDLESGEPLGFEPTASPFQTPDTPAAAALTVADILPEIPADLVRTTAVPQDQPVQIAPHVLSHALSSGTLSVPLFEVYRVCPGIFQIPVSPDDPRSVRLPAARLPALITSASSSAPQSPFASLLSETPESPFAAAPSMPLPAAPAAASGLISSLLGESAPPPPTEAFPFAMAPDPVSQGRPLTSLPPRRDPSQPPASFLPPTPLLDINGLMPAAGQESSPPPPPATFPAAHSPFGTEPVSPAPSTTAAPPSPFGMARSRSLSSSALLPLPPLLRSRLKPASPRSLPAPSRSKPPLP